MLGTPRIPQLQWIVHIVRATHRMAFNRRRCNVSHHCERSCGWYVFYFWFTSLVSSYMLQTCCDVQFILFLSVTLHPSKQHKHICAHACTHARTHALVTGTDGNSNVVTITPTPITNTLWAIVAFNFHFDCGIVSAFEQENASLVHCAHSAFGTCPLIVLPRVTVSTLE